jgi:hypothetical protein
MSLGLASDSGAAQVRALERRRRRFDELRASAKLEVRPAFGEELPELARILHELIPDLIAPFTSFCEVHSFSKSIYAVRSGSSLVGCFACLHLNSDGLKGLLNGSLSMSEPSRACLAECGAEVEAIYAWAWALRPPTNGIRAMGNLMAWLQRSEFSHAELYARPMTDKGLRFVAENLNTRPVDTGTKYQGLWVSTRFE